MVLRANKIKMNGYSMKCKAAAALAISGATLMALAGCTAMGAIGSQSEQRPDGTFSVSASDSEILLTESPKINGVPFIETGEAPKGWVFDSFDNIPEGDEKEYVESQKRTPPSMSAENDTCTVTFSSGTTFGNGISDIYLSRADLSAQTSGKGEDQHVLNFATTAGGTISFAAATYYQEGSGNGLVAVRVIEHPVETITTTDFQNNEIEQTLYPALRFTMWCSSELPDEKTVEKVIAAYKVDLNGK